MATRNYLPTLIVLIKTLCRYFDRYRVAINAAVDASSLTSDQKAAFHVFLNSIDAACAIAQIAEVPEGL